MWWKGEGQLGGEVGGMSWLFIIEYTALCNHSTDCALWEDSAWLTYCVLSGYKAIVEYLMRGGLRCRCFLGLSFSLRLGGGWGGLR